MKTYKKAFTLVELIITITIIAILGGISSMSIGAISDSNIKNKVQDTQVFLSDVKSELLKNMSSEVYLYMTNNTTNNQNKYIMGYLKKSSCTNISTIDEIFFNKYILDNYNYASFTGTLVSGMDIKIKKQESNNILSDIISTDTINLSHDVSVGDRFVYYFYQNNIYCGDLYVFFLDKESKKRYNLKQITVDVNGQDFDKNSIILKYSKSNIKPELFVSGTSQRNFYDSINFLVEDSIEKKNFEGYIN